MSEGTIGFGILGSGNMARVYGDALRTQVDGGRLVAVAMGSRAPAFAEEYAVEVAADATALSARSDVDVVVIATPHSTHEALAIGAAEAGKHVYLEKPMAMDIAQCDAIIKACRDNDVLLTIAKQTRHFEMSRKAKELLDGGAIGELRIVRAMSPFTSFGLGLEHWITHPGEGECFHDWGSHACDAFRWFTGSDAIRVYADYANFSGIAAPMPTALVQIRMASGVICQALLSYELPEPGLGTGSNNQYLLIGSTGMIEWDLDRVRLGGPGGWETIWELESWTDTWQPGHPRRIGNSARQVDDVIEAIRQGRPPAISGEDGRAAIEMTQAASISAATGQAVSLPLDTSGTAA